MAEQQGPGLELLASFKPPATQRAWHTTPHPDLPLVATSSSDKNVRIYSLLNFSLLSTITGGHKRSVRSSAWKPGLKGESVLATGSFDSSAGIWRRWDTRWNSQEIDEVDFTKQPRSEDDDDDEWNFSVVLDGPDSEVKSVSWSAGGQYLATCSRDKSVWIWEELEDDNFETVAVLTEHEGDVKCVIWHPEEELVASSSYDDTIRLWREDLDDWTCVSCLEGHEGTVWCIDFEEPHASKPEHHEDGEESNGTAHPGHDSRLVSCSDDMTIRIWKRVHKPESAAGQGKVPSILKTRSIEEEWQEESQLPKRHDMSIYAVAWSKRTGRVVSCGADGKIVVYEERQGGPKGITSDGGAPVTTPEPTSEYVAGFETEQKTGHATRQWVVVAEIEAAHDVYELNHVCWARRFDKGKRSDGEEMVLSTGDDGEVKAWVLNV